MADRKHSCPGGCGRQVPYHTFACKSCWFRLPAQLRRPIRDSHRTDPRTHRQAMADAQEWYRDNPLRGSR